MHAARLLFVLGLCASLPAQDLPARVLFLTESVGYRHEVVTRKAPDQLSLAEEALRNYCAPLFDVECTQDCSLINPEKLRTVRAVVFYTNQDLPISEDNRRALLEWIRCGGGFAGIHSATGTFRTFEPFTEMIGGLFQSHPWHEEVDLRVENPKHPATAHLGSSVRITDEIYQFTKWSRARTQVLLSLDGSSADLSQGAREDRDYALAWCHPSGHGRVFYTALGHRPEVWKDERFLRHVTGGILWAAGGEAVFEVPPRGAEILVGDGPPSALVHDGLEPSRWGFGDGVLTVNPGTGSLRTRNTHRDFQLHAEFRVPERLGLADLFSEGNSGIYLLGRYEVQICAAGDGPPDKRGCGAIYAQRAPDVNVARPSGEWQVFDIVFRSPRWDESGRKTGNARLTLVHNGFLVHRDVEITSKTGKGDPERPEPGPIVLQEHGSAVSFRNVWVGEAPQ